MVNYSNFHIIFKINLDLNIITNVKFILYDTMFSKNWREIILRKFQSANVDEQVLPYNETFLKK